MFICASNQRGMNRTSRQLEKSHAALYTLSADATRVGCGTIQLLHRGLNRFNA